ncbi:GNAT family N-acetyltransferase [uncultured Clostridium sp.]|uniref:GNAT family N-acetyltransferase n=1 Tax=uncultured Clostridium sp. TaxID=59620 RepID=UPI002638EBF8|nr:GNAT family N-acetyltransferase [uncultured Clostridium sp.]
MKWNIKKFNQLTLEELYEIMKSRYEVFACEQKIFQENDLDNLDKKVKHLFLEDKGRVVAYARVINSGIKSEYATVGRVLVLKEYRRKGLATELMEKAIEILKEDGEKKIIISAQAYAKGLYEEIGFKQISEEYSEVNIPHIEMEYIR